jgi:hypothetical protein
MKTATEFEIAAQSVVLLQCLPALPLLMLLAANLAQIVVVQVC